MISVKVGSTNIDGSGSAANLNSADQILFAEDEFYNENGLEASHQSATDEIVASADYWNAKGQKEVRVDAADTNVDVSNFVDVNINLETSKVDVNVDVANAKRGDVTTGNGNDVVSVSIQSNGAGWSNQFNIDTGAGDDSITVSNSVNSKFTSVNIDGGSGNDTIDISGLEAAVSGVQRIIDGGLGNDTITGSESGDIIYGGGGNDTINSNGGNDKIIAGHGDDTISSGAGNDLIWGDHGNDTIVAGEGNDIIRGGAGDDTIDAGDGYDEVLFDSADSSVDGGQGFDSLVISHSANIINAVGFEAIISNDNKLIADHVTIDLQDGLMVALGGDEGDSLSFNQEVTFTSLSQTFSEMLAVAETNMDSGVLDLFNAQGYSEASVNALNGYQASTGEIIWTDVDLLA